MLLTHQLDSGTPVSQNLRVRKLLTVISDMAAPFTIEDQLMRSLFVRIAPKALGIQGVPALANDRLHFVNE